MRAKDLMKTGVMSVRATDSVEDLLDALVGEHIHGAPVIDGEDTLVGVVTRSDFVQALDVLTATDRYHAATVAEFMTTNPATVTLADSCLVAAEVMRNRGLKGLPVLISETDRRVTGYVRAETLLSQVIGATQPALETDTAA